MRSFTEVDINQKNSGGVIIELSIKEAHLLYAAMEFFCERNKRKTTAKKLLNEMDKKFDVW